MLSCVANPQVTSCVWFNCLCNLFPAPAAEWERASPSWSVLCHQPTGLFQPVFQGELRFALTHTHTHTHTVSLAVRHGHSWNKACVGIEEHPAYICLSLWPIKPLLFLSLPPFTHGKVRKKYKTMLDPTLVIIIFHGNLICMFSSILKKTHVADENHDLLVTG